MISLSLGAGTVVLLSGESSNFYAIGKFKDPHFLHLFLKSVELNNTGSNLQRQYATYVPLFVVVKEAKSRLRSFLC